MGSFLDKLFFTAQKKEEYFRKVSPHFCSFSGGIQDDESCLPIPWKQKLKAHVHKLAQVSRTKEKMGEWEMGEVHQYFLALDDSSRLHAVQTLSCGGPTGKSS